jgi:Formate hydrogenlyase subunit 3/Multisubunit Na+/H+ antiporter, MnhD subunit
MALSAFFLVTADRSSREARDAGRLYLFATHVSTLVLFGFFALFRSPGRRSSSRSRSGVAGSDAGTVLFVLALLGFGLKAGLLPLHVWLPPAHAAAPAHVSALMSGVLIKTGIYGIVRFTSLVPDPPASWGDALLLLGAASAVLGVAFALGQHDLKRLLAWHSVENVGIIVLGLGVGLGARAAGRPEWALLGFAGGLFHVVNHGLFKPLLFLGAGEAAHVAGTRDMDRMGGLGKLLPKTALLFAAGAVAISGLPPLNGFASEWLVYLGLFDRARATGTDALRAAFGVPALALTGALALACFVKAHGAVFLGSARAEAPQLHGQPASHGSRRRTSRRWRPSPSPARSSASSRRRSHPRSSAPPRSRLRASPHRGRSPSSPRSGPSASRPSPSSSSSARWRSSSAGASRRRRPRPDLGLRLRAAHGACSTRPLLSRAGRSVVRVGAPASPEGSARREALPGGRAVREPRPRHRPRPRRRPRLPRRRLARPPGARTCSTEGCSFYLLYVRRDARRRLLFQV